MQEDAFNNNVFNLFSFFIKLFQTPLNFYWGIFNTLVSSLFWFELVLLQRKLVESTKKLFLSLD